MCPRTKQITEKSATADIVRTRANITFVHHYCIRNLIGYILSSVPLVVSTRLVEPVRTTVNQVDCSAF